jgi:hypothetical protein
MIVLGERGDSERQRKGVEVFAALSNVCPERVRRAGLGAKDLRKETLARNKLSVV